MIQIQILDSFYQYDTYHITKAFYPNEEIQIQLLPQNYEKGSDEVVASFVKYTQESMKNDAENIKRFQIKVSDVGSLPQKTETNKLERKQYKYQFNIVLYEHLEEMTGFSLKWGILNGMRPTKVAMKAWDNLQEEAEAYLQTHYRMSQDKAKLALEVAKREEALLNQLDIENGYSLYIGIPFCKTRCTYCSFTAYPLHLWEHRLDEYLDALCKELIYVAEVSKEKKLNTIYIGGGTPTSLSAKQLDRLLECLETHFSYIHVLEITVEAGRPDTITREKLEVMKKHQIPRISINPQTMQDKTLEAIGRAHTVQDIYDVYEMAREIGFENINMDLIMGLPGETLIDVVNTLESVEKMQPDSLTVHSLAMKRTSQLTKSGVGVEEKQDMEEMVEIAAKYAGKMNLLPYYLYRQKNMVGNYENVGYAKVDKAGIYNILIMEEKQSIIAVGAGSTTKIVRVGKEPAIVRIENVKDVNDYIMRIDEMIARKGEYLWH